DIEDETGGEEEEMPTEEPQEMTEEEMNEKYVERALQSIFKESKVDKLLSKYFVINENEKKFKQVKKQNKETFLETKKKSDKQKIKELSESLKQKNISIDIINNFPEMKFVGKTNLGNLIFEHNNKQLKVSRKGEIL
ncbi:hypothetical protein EBU94_02935, partial [bacterium]|nr:hypothetical protein [bacterium]